MSEIKKDSKDYIGYEYKELTASGERASFYLDCYQNFGWMPDERTGNGKSKLVLKRDRKIVNKVELTRLQRHFEACMDEIAALECSKTTNGAIAALIVGLIGTAFMARSVFAVTHIPPLMVLSVILAVPGFLGWILPWFIYQKMVSKRSKLVAELVERKYDEIYEICEQGNQRLN